MSEALLDRFDVLLHADWSVSPRKRLAALATRRGSAFYVEAPQRLDALLPSPDDPLTALPEALRRLSSTQGAICLALDMPLGVPRLIGAHTGVRSFVELLRLVEEGEEPWSKFFEPCERPEEISPYRPFYPRRPQGSRRQQLLDGLSVSTWEGLLRRCDHHVRGGAKPCPMFWTVGANQVGKGAAVGWRALIAPLRRRGELAIWPCDGSLEELVREDAAIIAAEVYPGEVYTWLELSWRGGGKRHQASRRALAGELIAAFKRFPVELSAACEAAIKDGFGEGGEGEDAFDCVVGLLGTLYVLSGAREVYEPSDELERELEGWILGRAPPVS